MQSHCHHQASEMKTSSFVFVWSLIYFYVVFRLPERREKEIYFYFYCIFNVACLVFARIYLLVFIYRRPSKALLCCVRKFNSKFTEVNYYEQRETIKYRYMPTAIWAIRLHNTHCTNTNCLIIKCASLHLENIMHLSICFRSSLLIIINAELNCFYCHLIQ